MRRVWAAAFTLLVLAPAVAAAPRRVVSFNLCADQLVLALADPGQIAALSPYARNPAISAAADAARAFPITAGSAEEALALGADLVFLGPRDRLATGQLLGGRGIRVERMPLATSLDDAKAIIRRTAAILGHAERGEALAARLDAARAGPGSSPTALPYERRGYAAGPTTMLGDALARAGFRHARPEIGFGGFVGLETIVRLRPDALVLNDAPGRADDQGTALLTHPALARLYPPARRIVVPDVLTVCPGPGLVEAIARLAAARAAATR
ncbi:MAG: ABC transporter substrate-binding protein [Rhizobiales bacterium]|nr:ABC transporter substrate-binding protein [Hyphomicrobiales bacterium]